MSKAQRRFSTTLPAYATLALSKWEGLVARMADIWDDSIKRLFREHPQDFVSLFVEGATYLEAVSGELKNRTRHADQLFKIAKRGKQSLLHIEAQSTQDEEIEDRLMEYNMLSMLTYKQPVITCLILLRPMAEAPISPVEIAAFDEIKVWQFHFVVFKLWEIPADAWLHTGLLGILPLTPLAKDGTNLEVLTTVVNELSAASEFELLTLTRLFAGLVMKRPEQQELLRRMFDMSKNFLEESWVYQEILQEGIEKGENRGLSLGEQRALLTIIKKRFPDIAQTASQQISEVTDTTLLESLIAEVSVAQTIQEALEVLNILNDDGHMNEDEAR